MNKYSKIYIAGHLGLVGSALGKTLGDRGYGNVVGRSRRELDLMDAGAVEAFFAAEKPEYVLLAAAKVGGIAANSTYRGQFIYENLMIQNNVIHQAYVHGVKKLLFLGSTCIYPREAPQPMPEDCLLTSPLEYTNEPYAIAKIAGIKLCESYNLQYGTNFLSVMPTNLYGPHDNFDLETSHVLPALIRKLHLGRCLETGSWEAIRADFNKRPVKGTSGAAPEKTILERLSEYGVTRSGNRVVVEIWGTGRPLREFLWSDDMAEACIYVLENVNFTDLIAGHSPDPMREVRNTHINIGTGKEVSIREAAELIKGKVGFLGELYFNTDKPDGTMKKLTDPSKIHALGWRHKVEIEQGIEKLYAWYASDH